MHHLYIFSMYFIYNIYYLIIIIIIGSVWLEGITGTQPFKSDRFIIFRFRLFSDRFSPIFLGFGFKSVFPSALDQIHVLAQRPVFSRTLVKTNGNVKNLFIDSLLRNMKFTSEMVDKDLKVLKTSLFPSYVCKSTWSFE